ncbi:MAG: isochorismatase family protein [Spirochaetales bacterium]|nr:isochorismatase family protein [Spirochaetales bacterium]
MRITAEDSILIVVDFQEKLVPHIFNGYAVAEKTAKLIKGIKALGVPVIATQQYTKGLGYSIPIIAEAMGAESPEEMEFIEKSSFSCFDCEEFKTKLDGYGRSNVIICGVEGHVCVSQTIVDLKAAGYSPVAVLDCISSRKEQDFLTAVKRYEYENAVLTCFESILFELCRFSGNEKFKAISALVK